jgi:putative sigma-54 modulation protein
MDIIVKAKNCDVAARVKDDAVERVTHALRFFDRISGLEMVFSEESNPRIPEPAVVELTGRTKGHHIRARAAAQDHRDAVDIAVNRFERQLSRYKARLVDKHRRAERAVPTGTGLLATAPDSVAMGDGSGDAAWEPPSIVRRKQFELTPMTIEEAALHLDLLDHEFYLFTNVHTGACNVVYRRRDGDLGLIEAR